MTAVVRQHDYALLTPWYQRIRDDTAVLSDQARRPSIQKYVDSDFTRRLVADPRDSIRFDPKDDVWSYTVPIGAVPLGPLTERQKLAGRLKVHTKLPKLYQPSHQRFYAAVIEVVCDDPGFPLLSSLEGLTVGFVVRRITTKFGGGENELRALARAVTAELFETQSVPDPSDESGVSGLLDLPDDGDPAQVAFRGSAHGEALIQAAQLSHVREAWKRAEDGQGGWVPVDEQPPGLAASSPGPEPGEATPAAEQEMPMWPVPAAAGPCARARHRALWFGVVPTFSGDLDGAGEPKLDDHSTYFLQCFLRQAPPAGHEHCPPRTWWSAESRPFRLAAFFDPDGTKNHRVRIKLPDLRALAARAGDAPAGGVAFERPPKSNLGFGPAGKIPTTGTVGGDSTEICTFAIELLTIVAMFVFSLFLPVVVFAFQLWWLLALRFCWPPSATALAALDAYFAGLPPNPLPIVDVAIKADLGGVLGLSEDDGAALKASVAATVPAANVPAAAGAIGKSITGALRSPPPAVPSPTPESQPRDPLCDAAP